MFFNDVVARVTVRYVEPLACKDEFVDGRISGQALISLKANFAVFDDYRLIIFVKTSG